MVGWPKKMGYTNFKNSYLINHEEPHDVPPTVGNIMTRDIIQWWDYLQLIDLIPLNSSIFARHHIWLVNIVHALQETVQVYQNHCNGIHIQGILQARISSSYESSAMGFKYVIICKYMTIPLHPSVKVSIPWWKSTLQDFIMGSKGYHNTKLPYMWVPRPNQPYAFLQEIFHLINYEPRMISSFNMHGSIIIKDSIINQQYEPWIIWVWSSKPQITMCEGTCHYPCMCSQLVSMEMTTKLKTLICRVLVSCNN